MKKTKKNKQIGVKDRVRDETDFIEWVNNIYNVCKTLSLRDKQVELPNKENYDINNDNIERHCLRRVEASKIMPLNVVVVYVIVFLVT